MNRLLTLFIFSLSFVISCKKDKAQPNPNVVTGNYSGIIVGSTGAYQIKITESGATGTLIFEGVKYALESHNVLTKQSQIFLVDKSGNMVITIEADATGALMNPSFRIPGHENMEATIVKETTTPAENYNGWRLNETASDFTNSIYNLSVNGNSFELISKTIASVNAEEIGNVKRIKGTVSRSGSQITLTYTENGSARTLTGIDALNKITIAETNGAKIELNKIDFAAALPPRPESYFTFKGNKYLLTQGGFESIKPFEWDETGRYHGVYFATDGLKLQGDDYRGVGKSIYITLTTTANQIFNLPGNYPSGGWNDDATLSPDYSLIGVDISDHYSATVVGPHTGGVIDDRVTEELRIKRHGIYYEVTMKGYADLESTGPGLGLFELHYYGPLSQK